MGDRQVVSRESSAKSQWPEANSQKPRAKAKHRACVVQIVAEFVTSAASADDFPRDRLPEVAMVGRSNVGKSSLINALVRQQLARTSATPGKTRLANIYRVRRGSMQACYLVDLPGYGYARAARPSEGTIAGADLRLALSRGRSASRQQGNP